MSLNDLKSEIKTDMHTAALDEFLQRLGADPERGLSREEAAARLVRDGKNALKPLKQTPEIIKFARNTFQGFGLLMWIGGFLMLLSFIFIMAQNQWSWELTDKSDLVLGIVLLTLVLVTGAFSYLQEFRSAKVMQKFLKMLPQKTIVVRDGVKFEINVCDLVVGDVVHVKGGDKVPADIRILQSRCAPLTCQKFA